MPELPKSPNDLTPKERQFWAEMMRQIEMLQPKVVPLGAGVLRHIGYRFPIPPDFTEEEFQRVGHCLTILYWSWEDLGKRGEARWAYILFPFG